MSTLTTAVVLPCPHCKRPVEPEPWGSKAQWWIAKCPDEACPGHAPVDGRSYEEVAAKLGAVPVAPSNWREVAKAALFFALGALTFWNIGAGLVALVLALLIKRFWQRR